jgi:hypothetical protein
VKPTPTGKVEPASPRKSPRKRSCVKLLDNPTATAGIADRTSSAAKTRRPPKRSASIPAGRRPREPSSTGMAMSRLLLVAESL